MPSGDWKHWLRSRTSREHTDRPCETVLTPWNRLKEPLESHDVSARSSERVPFKDRVDRVQPYSSDAHISAALRVTCSRSAPANNAGGVRDSSVSWAGVKGERVRPVLCSREVSVVLRVRDGRAVA